VTVKHNGVPRKSPAFIRQWFQAAVSSVASALQKIDLAMAFTKFISQLQKMWTLL